MLSITVLAAVEGEGGSSDFWESAYPIIPHPGEMIVGLVCFAVVLWVFTSKVVPMLEKAHAARVAAIEGGMEEAQRDQKEARALLDRYQTQLDGVKDEANQIREEARADAAAVASELREKAQQDANRIVEAAHRQVEADRQQAMVSLRQDVGRLATDLAGRIVGESLTEPARQSGVIDRFIAELEQADAASVRSAAATAEGTS
ncbi:MAG: F0F1 ATP synthase subunit B [Actinomycetales bacterium]